MDSFTVQFVFVATVVLVVLVGIVVLWERLPLAAKTGLITAGGLALGGFAGYLSAVKLGSLTFCVAVVVFVYATSAVYPVTRLVANMGMVEEQEPWPYRLSVLALIVLPPLVSFIVVRAIWTA